MSDLQFEPNVSLAALTTLGVGGSARLLARVQTEAEIGLALDKARDEGLKVLVLGGGSNLLVSDKGVDALVLVLENQSIECLERLEDSVVLKVGAGCVWDDFVAYCVEQGYSGVECLSGIPGCMGAAPIQNIGAYGQEASQVIESVGCVSKMDGRPSSYSNEACGFGYRTSHFKKGPLKTEIVAHVVVRLSLSPAQKPLYPELIRACGEDCRDLKTLRETVIRLRRAKSMIYDTDDPNHRSAGSFFVNPIVSVETVESVRAALKKQGIEHEHMPCFAQGDGQFKLSAAWLMDRAGYKKGFGQGLVGLSTNHCLAIVNRGGASCVEIQALMATVQEGVWAQFGVQLNPEPVFWGDER
jgi:UDP-N-acetylmuramate dehydrogenase